jgi:hypothetical protein
MRPINLFGSFQNGGLGQSRPLTGLSLGYNEASQWLADAEKVVSANPACNLPIVDTFRQFVNGTASADRLGARLDLNPDDMRSLADFKQCQISPPAAVHALEAAAAAAATEKKDRVVGLAASAVALLGLGYLISKAS